MIPRKESRFMTLSYNRMLPNTITCQQLRCSIFRTPPIQQKCCELRRKLPGYFDSESKVNILKAKLRREFEVVWQPQRTHSGWQISPERLRETLLFLYWWLPPNEWWKIYGDGRNFGGKDSVAITLNVLNSEAVSWSKLP